MQNYLEHLNKAQRKAVENTEGPTLIIAGAGSGKTRVLTYRIAHLLKLGIAPYNILALTFTNKAAAEMKERIAEIVGIDAARRLWMGTFHSVFARILRNEAEAINYSSSFTIYDSADSKNLIKSIIKELGLNNNKNYKPSKILSRISKAKNNLVTPNAYIKDKSRIANDQASQIPFTYEIYNRYALACRKSMVMDFDDLLLNTNILFRDNPEILEKYQNFFRYILVDEYQDTNYSQYFIIKKLSAIHKNICVVGDDAQSIYSFRGAKIENILNFRNDYPNYSIFKLEQNYRSTQNIVNAANSIISKNTKQIQKKVFSENAEGEKIKIYNAYSDIEEGHIVLNDIKNKILNNKYSFQDFAILYRTNAQSRIFEDVFLKNKINYKIYGGLSFYQRKEIKDLLAYYRAVVNSNDSEAIKRIINYPARGIGKTTTDRIEVIANKTNDFFWNILVNIDKYDNTFNSGTRNKIKKFVNLIAEFKASASISNAHEVATAIANKSGIVKELYKERTPEAISRQENIQELFNSIQEFCNAKTEEGESASLVNFLEEVSLLTDQDNEKAEDKNKITLMTIHASKGLEFKNVYIVGVEEGLFPSLMTSENMDDIEEERRLFYVALTRAEQNAVITFARTRYKYGEMSVCRPSRFISDISDEFTDFASTKITFNSRSKSNTSFKRTNSLGIARNKYNFNSNNNSVKDKIPLGQQKQETVNKLGKFEIGMTIEHKMFGIGEIKSLEGEGANAKATVVFKNAGKKQLLLKFARLKILS